MAPKLAAHRMTCTPKARLGSSLIRSLKAHSQTSILCEVTKSPFTILCGFNEGKIEKISKLFNHNTVWAGMIGPAFFVTVFTVEGWLRPGYEPLKTYVSALSLGPRGWIQIANFILFGGLLFLFTRGVAAEFPKGKASRSGLTLLTIIAFTSTQEVLQKNTWYPDRCNPYWY